MPELPCLAVDSMTMEHKPHSIADLVQTVRASLDFLYNWPGGKGRSECVTDGREALDSLEEQLETLQEERDLLHDRLIKLANWYGHDLDAAIGLNPARTRLGHDRARCKCGCATQTTTSEGQPPASSPAHSPREQETSLCSKHGPWIENEQGCPGCVADALGIPNPSHGKAHDPNPAKRQT